MDSGAVIVAIIGAVVSLGGALLAHRANQRQVTQQEHSDTMAQLASLSKLFQTDNEDLREQIKDLRGELITVQTELHRRKDEHHRCLEEVQTNRMYMLLLVRAVPQEQLPVELRDYIRNLKGDVGQ